MRVLEDRLGNAVRAEHGDCTIGDFIELIDEPRTLAFERLDDVAVMHDLVAYIDGLAVLLERLLDDVDGTDDAGTEAARLGEDDAHVRILVQSPSSRRRLVCPIAQMGRIRGTKPAPAIEATQAPGVLHLCNSARLLNAISQGYGDVACAAPVSATNCNGANTARSHAL